APHQDAQKLRQARGWTATQVETAAKRVEVTVAPRVADLLNTAAHRVDPKPSRRGLRALRENRKVSRTLLIGGAAVVGGVLVYSMVRMRQASQDAEWQEHLDQARDQVRETRENLGAKASEATGKASKNEAKEPAEAGTGSDKGGSTKSS